MEEGYFLIIESISFGWNKVVSLFGDMPTMRRPIANVTARLETSRYLSTYANQQFISEGRGNSEEECLKAAIENFINGRLVEGEYPTRINIKGVQINLKEPWLSLFNQLLDEDSWFHLKNI